MQATRTPAHELPAALERYERDVKRLATHWRDAELYRVARVRELQQGCRGLVRPGS